MSIGLRDRLISIVVAFGILGGLVALATGESGTAERPAATRAELWGRALADLKSAGSGTYRVDEVHEGCDTVPVGTPCEGVARTITQTGTYFLDPDQLSQHHVLTVDGAVAVEAGTIVTADGRAYWRTSGAEAPDPCWTMATPEFTPHLSDADSIFPWSLRALLDAEVTDRSRPPALPAELRATAPAIAVIGFLNPLVALELEVDPDARLPVRVRLDRGGQVAGLTAVGADLDHLLSTMIRSGQVGARGGDQSVLRGLVFVVSSRVDLTVDDLGKASEVEPPDADLIEDGPRSCAAAR